MLQTPQFAFFMDFVSEVQTGHNLAHSNRGLSQQPPSPPATLAVTKQGFNDVDRTAAAASIKKRAMDAATSQVPHRGAIAGVSHSRPVTDGGNACCRTISMPFDSCQRL